MHAIQTSRSSSSSSRRELQEVPATNDISIGKSSIHALYQNLISEHSVCSLWWWTPNKTKPSWKLFLISVFVSKKPNPWCQARSQLFQSQDLGLDLENIVERLEPSVNQKNVFVVFFFCLPSASIQTLNDTFFMTLLSITFSDEAKFCKPIKFLFTLLPCFSICLFLAPYNLKRRI